MADRSEAWTRGDAIAAAIRDAISALEHALELVEQGKRDGTLSDHLDRLHNLSERELQVLKLMNEGLTDNQIAEQLGISIRTAEKHGERVFKKLGVPNRTSATRLLRG